VLRYTQDDDLDGLAATTAEVVVPKAPAAKKKGKRGGAPRQRQVRITNTHLRGEIDLAGEFAAQTK
jgi:transcription initiation factor TFIIE subunit beta